MTLIGGGSSSQRRGRAKYSGTSHPYQARSGKEGRKTGYGRVNSNMDDDTTIFTVVKTTQVKSLAGAIAHRAREGELPVLTALGPQSVNQAVKALAIANDFVKDEGFRLLGQAKRVVDPERDLRDLFMITITKANWQDASNEDSVELKCASVSDPEAVAAAIRRKMGESKSLRVTSIGPLAVFKTVDSLSRTENLRFLPEFLEVELDGGEYIANGLHFHLVLSHQSSSSKSTAASVGRQSRRRGNSSSRANAVGDGRRSVMDKTTDCDGYAAREMSMESERPRVSVSNSSQVNVLAG
jgi:stage V sporulation protein SpoVS